MLDRLDGYGVCQFTAESLLEEVARLRASDDNDFHGEVSISFDPNRVPRKGHAHCYIDPMPAIVQKALYRRIAKMTDGYMPGPPVAGRRANDETSS